MKKTVNCGRAGYIRRMDATRLGLAAQAMGAGRLELDDVLDYSVGFILPVRVGDRVEADTPLCTLYAKDEASAAQAEKDIRNAIEFSDEPCDPIPDCFAVVRAEGITRFGEKA